MTVTVASRFEAPPDRHSGHNTPHRNYTQLYVPERTLQDIIAKYFPSREEVKLYQCDIASCRGKFNMVLKVCVGDEISVNFEDHSRTIMHITLIAIMRITLIMHITLIGKF